MPPEGSTSSSTPVGIRREEPPQPLVRPAPVVDRRGVVPLDSVRRGEHAAPGSGDATKLAHGLRRVVAVLEHLRAEHEVEARRPRREAPRPGRAARPRDCRRRRRRRTRSRARRRTGSTASGRSRRRGRGSPSPLARLRLEPRGERRADGPRRRAQRRVPPLLTGPVGHAHEADATRGASGTPRTTGFFAARGGQQARLPALVDDRGARRGAGTRGTCRSADSACAIPYACVR